MIVLSFLAKSMIRINLRGQIHVMIKKKKNIKDFCVDRELRGSKVRRRQKVRGA